MKKNKILYVSDLGGTLLNSDQNISVYTADIINGLVKKGMILHMLRQGLLIPPFRKLQKSKVNFPLLFTTVYL